MPYYLSNCPPSACDPCGPYGYNQRLPQPCFPFACEPSIQDGRFNNICVNGTGVFEGNVTAARFIGPVSSSATTLTGTTTVNSGRVVINPTTTTLRVVAGPIATPTLVTSLAAISYISTTTVGANIAINLGTNLSTFGTPGQILYIRNFGTIPLIITAGRNWMPANGSTYIPIDDGTLTVLGNSLTQFVNVAV